MKLFQKIGPFLGKKIISPQTVEIFLETPKNYNPISRANIFMPSHRDRHAYVCLLSYDFRHAHLDRQFGVMQSTQIWNPSHTKYYKCFRFYAHTGNILEARCKSSHQKEYYQVTEKKSNHLQRISQKEAYKQAIKHAKLNPFPNYRPIPEFIKLMVWHRDQGRCNACGNKLNLEFDHIIPLQQGGSSSPENIQLLCLACNRKKGGKIVISN